MSASTISPMWRRRPRRRVKSSKSTAAQPASTPAASRGRSTSMSNVYQFKDFEGSSHRILIDLIRRYASHGGRLLDLGASTGQLGAAVRDHFSRTVGFEYEL